MEFLEYFGENRKKVIYIQNLVKQLKQEKISFEEFRLRLSTFLSKFLKMTVPVTIIDDKYPQIFINCDVENFKIISKGLYISKSLFANFLSEELTAAILHEAGHFYRIKKNPDLIKWFYRSRRMGYVYSTAGMIVTFLLNYIKNYISKEDVSNQEKVKSVKYFKYIMIILLITTVISVALSSYYFYKVGNEEYIADSFATKFGYGKELISFMKKYEELESMYGHKSLPRIMETLSNFTRNIMKIIGLHPHDGKRFCEICRDIIEKYDSKNKFDMDLYKWAKQQYKLYCKGHKQVEDKDLERIKKVLFFMKKKLK